jgi:anti-sigma factor RsiW
MENHDHDRAECLRMFEKLSEYLDEELDAASCRDMEKHMEGCVKCHACLETLRRTIEICKQMESKPVPSTFSKRLRQLIAEMEAADAVSPGE